MKFTSENSLNGENLVKAAWHCLRGFDPLKGEFSLMAFLFLWAKHEDKKLDFEKISLVSSVKNWLSFRLDS